MKEEENGGLKINPLFLSIFNFPNKRKRSHSSPLPSDLLLNPNPNILKFPETGFFHKETISNAIIFT